MSEEPKIFRSGQDPEQGLAQKSVPAAKAPAPVPTVDAPVVPKPAAAVAPAVVATPAPVQPEPEPEPELDFHLDDSQLFHTQEGVKQRMARLASIAHSTSDLLDEQAAETARIAKRLKSL